jgi:hypothetical protein
MESLYQSTTYTERELDNKEFARLFIEQNSEGSNPYLTVHQVFEICHKERPWDFMLVRALRHACTCKWAWAIPDENALDTLADFSPILEVGAGTGYWASLLEHRGVDVLAVDKNPPGSACSENPYGHYVTYTSVHRGTSRTPREHQGRTLFMCWPPYRSHLALRALRTYRGEYFLYVGEGTWGCTGSEGFHRELDKYWKSVKVCSIPQWPGIRDALFVYRRKHAD